MADVGSRTDQPMTLTSLVLEDWVDEETGARHTLLRNAAPSPNLRQARTASETTKTQMPVRSLQASAPVLIQAIIDYNKRQTSSYSL